MRILLLGGNGFIGSHLAERLRDEGHVATVMDPRAPRADVDWRGIEYRRAEYRDARTLGGLLDACDVVVHLASTTVPSSANRDPAFDVSTNLIDMLALIAAMRERGRRRIVFFSSGGTVYGNPERLPVDERQPLSPICSYGIVKMALEKYLLMYQLQGDLDPLILRPSNPYGPRQPTAGSQGFVATAMARLRGGRTLEIWGDGGNIRDYLYIDDLVDFARRATLSDICGVYNAGSGIGFSIEDVRAAIERAVGRAIAVEYKPARPYDVRAVVLDIAAAGMQFGWAPSVGLDDGVARTWRWLQTGPRHRPEAATT